MDTHNVISIHNSGRCDAFNTEKLNILGIVDHKLIHEEHTNCTLITSSAWINLNGVSSGRISLHVSRTIENVLSESKSSLHNSGETLQLQ